MIDKKRCVFCGIKKDILEFDKVKGGCALRNTCKACYVVIFEKLKSVPGRIKKEQAPVSERREKLLKNQREYSKVYDKLPSSKEQRRKMDKTPRGKARRARIMNRRRINSKDLESSLTVEQWEKIIELQKNKCVLCGKKFTKKDPATRDHIIPVSKQGPFTRENCQAVHGSCNSKKLNKIDKSNVVSWISRPDLCLDEIQMPY